MQEHKFQHTRSTGLGLTYEVRVVANRYIISHQGAVLKDALRPTVVGGNVSDDDATKVFAISDIEDLVGMSEQ